MATTATIHGIRSCSVLINSATALITRIHRRQISWAYIKSFCRCLLSEQNHNGITVLDAYPYTWLGNQDYSSYEHPHDHRLHAAYWLQATLQSRPENLPVFKVCSRSHIYMNAQSLFSFTLRAFKQLQGTASKSTKIYHQHLLPIEVNYIIKSKQPTLHGLPCSWWL